MSDILTSGSQDIELSIPMSEKLLSTFSINNLSKSVARGNIHYMQLRGS